MTRQDKHDDRPTWLEEYESLVDTAEWRVGPDGYPISDREYEAELRDHFGWAWRNKGD